MTCYTSLAIIARDLMSDQVRHWCVGFYLTFTDWSAMIHGETETYRFWLTMVEDELLCIIDRPSWKSKESKIAQQWLSQYPKSPPVININHVSLKSFKCFRNYNGAPSEHTTLAITWLPVVLNWSESELSKGCFNLQGLDGRILGGTPLSGQNTMLIYIGGMARHG